MAEIALEFSVTDDVGAITSQIDSTSTVGDAANHPAFTAVVVMIVTSWVMTVVFEL